MLKNEIFFQCGGGTENNLNFEKVSILNALYYERDENEYFFFFLIILIEIEIL